MCTSILEVSALFPQIPQVLLGFFIVNSGSFFLLYSLYKMLMFPGSSTKITCLFWPTSPPAINFLARLPSHVVVNTVLLSFLNKLLQRFPLSSHPISKFLLVEDSSQAPPGSSLLSFCSLLICTLTRLLLLLQCLHSCCEIFIYDTL